MADDEAKRYKNVDAPLGSGERAAPIPLTHKTLSGIAAGGLANLNFVRASAGHDNFDRALAPKGKFGAEADAALAAARAEKQLIGESVTTTGRREKQTVAGGMLEALYARGDTVVDTERGKKCTVMKVFGYTAKGTPIYKVADKTGENRWLVKETKLRPRK